MNRNSDMIIVLSPAKSLDYDTPLRTKTHTLPDFIERPAELIDALHRLSPAQIGTLTHISDLLAALNAARYTDWSSEFTAENSKQAALAFDGDVYGGLDANSLTVDDLQLTQEHLRVLPRLCGVLRPLNWMQPYRLKMGTCLASPRGRDLYTFWGDEVTLVPNRLFKQDDGAVLISLTPEEYFKMVRPRMLEVRTVTPAFEDWENGQYRIISFYAKRACDLMAHYAIKHRVTDPRKLRMFDVDGYAFVAVDSDDGRWIFRRKLT